MSCFRTGLMVLVACATARHCVSAAVVPIQVSTSDEWRVIYLGGERIGSERTRFVRNGDSITITWAAGLAKRSRRGMHLREDGTVTVDAVGVLKSFRHRTEPAAGRFVEYTGTLGSDRLQLSTETPGRKTRTEFVVPKMTRSLRWFRWHQRERPMPTEARTRMTVFEPGIGTEAQQVTIETGRWKKVTTPSGRRLKLLSMTTTRTTRPGAERCYMDEQGRIVLVEFDHNGVTLTSELVPRSVALTKDAIRQFDAQLTRFIPSKRSLAAGETVRQASFEVSGPPALLAQLKTVSSQAVAVDTGKLRIAVSAPELQPVRRSKRAHRSYLASSRVMDLANSQYSQRARELGLRSDKRFQIEQTYDKGVIAMKLQSGVDRLVRNRRFSIETPAASEIMKDPQGDCTEHAVLLAAMLRVHRIPSRVVAGLRYSDGRPGFTAHMWAEAMLNGEWVTLDAMRGTKQPGAEYIAVRRSALVDDESPEDLMISLADVISEMGVEVVPDDANSQAGSTGSFLPRR